MVQTRVKASNENSAAAAQPVEEVVAPMVIVAQGVAGELGASLSQYMFFQLQHPKMNCKATFALHAESGQLYEILRFDDERSWFINDFVVDNGSISFLSPINALFLALPYVQKNARTRFVSVHGIFGDDDLAATKYLSNSKQLWKDLHLICDVQDVMDQKVCRLNEEKLMAWLCDRFERLSTAIKLAGDIPKAVLDNEVFLKRYVFGVLCDYLSSDVEERLRLHLGIEKDVVPAADGGGKRVRTEAVEERSEASLLVEGKKAAKLTVAQKQLQKVVNEERNRMTVSSARLVSTASALKNMAVSTLKNHLAKIIADASSSVDGNSTLARCYEELKRILPNWSAGTQLVANNASDLDDLFKQEFVPVVRASLAHAISASRNSSLQLDVLDVLGLLAQIPVSSTASRLDEQQTSHAIEQINKLCGAQSTDLRVASKAVWCFGYLQQHMDCDMLAGHLGIIFDIINKLLPLETPIAQLNSRPSSLLGSLLSFLSNVMTRLPSVLVGLRDKWLLYAFNLSVCEAPLLHDRALVVLQKLQDYSAKEKTQIELSAAVRSALKSHIAKEMIRLFGVGHQSHVMNLWGVIVQLLGRHLHDGASLLNALLPVIEVGCKAKDNEEIRKLIYKDWKILIQNFALDPIRVLGHDRRLKLILQLFQKHTPLDTEAVSEAKTIAWWTLLVCLGDQLCEHRLDILVPFLRFCVGGDIIIISQTNDAKFNADFGKSIVAADNRVSIAVPEKLAGNLPQTLPSFENARRLLGEVLLNLFYGETVDVVSFTRKLAPLASALLTNPAFSAADFIPFLLQCIRAWFHSVSASSANCDVCSLCWLAVFKQLRKIRDAGRPDGRLLENVVVQFCQFLKENLSLDKTKQLWNMRFKQEFLKLLADSLSFAKDSCLSSITFPEEKGSFGLLLWRIACDILPVNAASADENLICILSQSSQLVFSDLQPISALTKGHSLLRRTGEISSLSVSAVSSLWLKLAEETTSFLQKKNEIVQAKIANNQPNVSFVIDLLVFPIAKLTYEECDKMEQVHSFWKSLFMESVRCEKLISSIASDSSDWLICHEYSEAVMRLDASKKKDLLPRAMLRFVAFTCKLVCEETNFLESIANCRSYESSGSSRRTQFDTLGPLRPFAAVLEQFSNACFSSEPVDRLDVAAATDLSFAILQLFKRIRVPAAIHTLFLQFGLSMRNIARLLNEKMPRQLTKLTPNLEQSLLTYLQAAYDFLMFDHTLLNDSAQLFALALNHSRLQVKKSATELWKRIFAPNVTSQNCPAALMDVLLALKAKNPQLCPLLAEPTLNISNDQMQSDQTDSTMLLDEGQDVLNMPLIATLPIFDAVAVAGEPPAEKVNLLTSAAANATEGSCKNSKDVCNDKLLPPQKATVASPSTSKGKLSATPHFERLEDAPADEFVVINQPETTPKRVLTSHQKEVLTERTDMPFITNPNLLRSDSQSLGLSDQFTTESQMANSQSADDVDLCSSGVATSTNEVPADTEMRTEPVPEIPSEANATSTSDVSIIPDSNPPVSANTEGNADALPEEESVEAVASTQSHAEAIAADEEQNLPLETKKRKLAKTPKRKRDDVEAQIIQAVDAKDSPDAERIKRPYRRHNQPVGTSGEPAPLRRSSRQAALDRSLSVTTNEEKQAGGRSSAERRSPSVSPRVQPSRAVTAMEDSTAAANVREGASPLLTKSAKKGAKRKAEMNDAEKLARRQSEPVLISMNAAGAVIDLSTEDEDVVPSSLPVRTPKQQHSRTKAKATPTAATSPTVAVAALSLTPPASLQVNVHESGLPQAVANTTSPRSIQAAENIKAKLKMQRTNVNVITKRSNEFELVDLSQDEVETTAACVKLTDVSPAVLQQKEKATDSVAASSSPVLFASQSDAGDVTSAEARKTSPDRRTTKSPTVSEEAGTSRKSRRASSSPEKTAVLSSSPVPVSEPTTIRTRSHDVASPTDVATVLKNSSPDLVAEDKSGRKTAKRQRSPESSTTAELAKRTTFVDLTEDADNMPTNLNAKALPEQNLNVVDANRKTETAISVVRKSASESAVVSDDVSSDAESTSSDTHSDELGVESSNVCTMQAAKTPREIAVIENETRPNQQDNSGKQDEEASAIAKAKLPDCSAVLAASVAVASIPPLPLVTESPTGILKKKRGLLASSRVETTATASESCSPGISAKKRKVSFAPNAASEESSASFAADTTNDVSDAVDASPVAASRLHSSVSPKGLSSPVTVNRSLFSQRTQSMVESVTKAHNEKVLATAAIAVSTGNSVNGNLDSVIGAELESPNNSATTSVSSDHSILNQSAILDDQLPIWPSLADCIEPIDILMAELTSSTWCASIRRQLKGRGITTVGDLCRLSEYDIDKLGLRSTDTMSRTALFRSVVSKFEAGRKANAGNSCASKDGHERNVDQNDVLTHNTTIEALTADAIVNSIGQCGAGMETTSNMVWEGLAKMHSQFQSVDFSTWKHEEFKSAIIMTHEMLGKLIKEQK